MVGYFAMGKYWPYALDDDRNGFLLQTAKKVDFNTSPLIANASYLRGVPIWGHPELRITRVWADYYAEANDTRVRFYLCTGADPIGFISIPLGEIAATKDSMDNPFDSGEIDVSMEPVGSSATTSGVQFLLMTAANYAAGDDVTVRVQGWYRGAPQTTQWAPTPPPEPQSVILDGIRSLRRR